MRHANEHRWVDHSYLIEHCKRHAQGCLLVAETFQQFGGPGAIRTRDTRFRRAVLYPLSYGAIWSRVPGAHEYRHACAPAPDTRQMYRQMMLSDDLQRTPFRLVNAD